MLQPLNDKGWLRQLRPGANAIQIEAFVERVAIKLEEESDPLPVVVQKARMEAFIEMGFADVD